MTYVALARRFRPQTFADVAAQTHVTETLQQAIVGKRVAPAYLFAGPRGSGKTTLARILAKAVNCEAPKDGEPDGTCESCVSIAEGRSLDVIEIDGASNNSVDDVRELRESVRYAPSQPGKRKVYIVDEVHMLSPGAFNALLKTLEEPPPHVLFVFATTEPRKVPPTILSRCQRFDFRRLRTDEIQKRLDFICKKEKLEIEPEAVFVLARRADGSLRDALSLLDQVVSSTRGSISATTVAEVLGLVREESYLELVTAFADRDPVRALGTLHAVLRAGADPGNFALGLVEHCRNLMMLGLDTSLRGSVPMGEAHLQQAQALAARFKVEDLLYLLNRAALLYEDVRRSAQAVVVLEAAIVEMARFESRVVLTELLQQLGTGPQPDDTGAGARGASASPGRAAAAPPPSRRGSNPRAEASVVDMTARLAPVPPSDSVAPRATAPPPAVAPPRAAPGGAAPEAFAAGGPPPGAPSQAVSDAVPRAPAATAMRESSAGIDLATVCSRWSEFTQALRGSKAMLAHCLQEGRPVRFAAGTLEVGFAPEHTFQRHLFEEAVKRRELEAYLTQFFGAPLRVAIATDAAADVAVPAAAQRVTPEQVADSRREAIDDVVDRTPVIDALLDTFDGEVLDDPQI